MRFFAKTVALEEALGEVCKRFKVDVMAIKKLAGCPDNDELSNETCLQDWCSPEMGHLWRF